MRSLYEYIAFNNSAPRADTVVSGIEKMCSTLAEFPDRGHLPPELEGRQRTDIREIRFKPYRILYSVQPSGVYVLAVFDGRRDARALIEQRLIRDNGLE
jgi:toxin ParE1/3/4